MNGGQLLELACVANNERESWNIAEMFWKAVFPDGFCEDTHISALKDQGYSPIAEQFGAEIRTSPPIFPSGLPRAVQRSAKLVKFFADQFVVTRFFPNLVFIFLSFPAV
jgi:hypothetical protein